MTAELRRELVRLVMSESLGEAAAKDYVTWGVRALAAGHDSPSLRQLAGADLGNTPVQAEVAPVLQAALRELGVSPLSPEAAVHEYARSLVEEILAGSVDPQAQVERIHEEVLTPFDHPADLMVFCHLSEGSRPRVFAKDFVGVSFDEVQGEELDSAIREAAIWFLQGQEP